MPRLLEMVSRLIKLRSRIQRAIVARLARWYLRTFKLRNIEHGARVPVSKPTATAITAQGAVSTAEVAPAPAGAFQVPAASAGTNADAGLPIAGSIEISDASPV